jgi:hypothetical protein
MEWIAFYRPETRSRVVGLWARFGAPQTAVVPAAGTHARLIWPDGSTQQLIPVNGAYTVQLPAATNQNMPWDPTLYPVGGRPAMLVELDDLPPAISPVIARAVTGTLLYVQWSGDDGLGSGLAGYDILIARDGHPVEPWRRGVQETTLLYPAEPGHSYTFTVIARDHAGNASPTQTATVVAEPPVGLMFMPVMPR